MDLTASSAVILPIINASLRLVVIWTGVGSILCHVGRGASSAATHSYNKFDVFHHFSYSLGERRTGGEKDASHFLHRPGYLRGLAVQFCFQAFFAANAHLDLLGFGFSLLGKANFQHALVIVDAHLPRIHGTG
jgi:hypothetical protein